MNNEIWKDVEGYEGVYSVSNMGRVKNIKTGRYLKETDNGCGYYRVILFKNNKGKNMYVHRLVALAFIENTDPNVKTQVNHKDENKSNNISSNLEWVTAKENANYGTRNERFMKTRKFNGNDNKCLDNLKKGRQKKRVLCISTGEIFESTHDAASKYNVRFSGISACCLGKAKTCGGLKWKYLKEE